MLLAKPWWPTFSPRRPWLKPPVPRPPADEHPRRTASQNDLQLRPPGRTLAADSAPPAGAALPDARAQLLAAHPAGKAFHQLAAGPAEQFPGAAGVPRAHARVL